MPYYNKVVKQQSLNITAKSEATSPPTISSGSDTTGNARGRSPNKEKALTENVLRKRSRDAESVSENLGIVPALPTAGQITKKIKTDLLKNPLSSVTNTNFLLQTSGAMANSESQGSVPATSQRPKLLAQLSAASVGSHDEQPYTSILEKPPRSAYGVQGTLPNMHGIRPLSLGRARPLPQSFPMPIGPIAGHSSAYNGGTANMVSSPCLVPQVTPLVNERLTNMGNLQASGSNHALSPTQIASGQKIDQMSFNQPSDTKSTSTPILNGGVDLFSEEDSDGSSDNEDMPNVANFLSRIGVAAPPPLVGNDAMDENGDYYGRGRDLFPSPRASHDE